MIREAFVNWKRATENLLMLTKEKDEEKRDETIEKINQLLDVRDQLQGQIQAPFTDEEKVFRQELITMEAKLQHELKNYMENIRQEISVSKSKGSHMKSYVNPYQSLARDGAYYDTKQ